MNPGTWVPGTDVPEPRRWQGMGYIGDDKALLFGGLTGTDSSTYKNDTWIYDYSENTWTKITPIGVSPSARIGAALAYYQDDKILLFGGNSGGYSDETWAYDISDNAWTQQVTVTKPPADYQYRMAHLGIGMVLYHYNDETWVYTSTGGWTNMNPTTAPPYTCGNDIAYLGEDRALMFGGSLGWPPMYNDAWIYDYSENTWSIDPNTTKPSFRNECGLAESSMDGTGEIVLFGGRSAAQVFPDDTWLFGVGEADGTPIPTITEWGMIIFFLSLGSIAIWYMRKQTHRGKMA